MQELKRRGSAPPGAVSSKPDSRDRSSKDSKNNSKSGTPKIKPASGTASGVLSTQDGNTPLGEIRSVVDSRESTALSKPTPFAHGRTFAGLAASPATVTSSLASPSLPASAPVVVSSPALHPQQPPAGHLESKTNASSPPSATVAHSSSPALPVTLALGREDSGEDADTVSSPQPPHAHAEPEQLMKARLLARRSSSPQSRRQQLYELQQRKRELQAQQSGGGQAGASPSPRGDHN